MSFSSTLGRLRRPSRSRDRGLPTQPAEAQLSTISLLFNRGTGSKKKTEFEVPEYRSLLSEDAIPNLQRILASAGGTVLAMSVGDGLRNALKVMELEETVLNLLRHIRVLRNHALPISSLPPELLSMIFEFVATPPDDSTPMLGDVISLTHVCHYWRTILLNHKSVWSEIHLDGQDPGLVAQQLERCGGATLNVNIHLQYWKFRRENTRLLSNFRGALTVIRLHRSQVRRLAVQMACCQAFHNYFNFDLPNLEELVWEDLCVKHAITHNSTPPNPERNLLPRLSYLSVKNTLYWPVEYTNGLTTFKLEGHMTVTPDKLIDFLQRNPALESLELINLHIPYQWHPQKPIELDDLETLIVHNAEHGHIFPYIATRALKRLEIGPFEQPPRWIGSVWFNLQVPSDITTLSIVYDGSGGDPNVVSVVGFDKVSRRLLALAEHSVGRRLTPVLNALANASLDTVTTLSFDGRGVDPEERAPTPPILALLRSVPQLAQVDLGWGYLTHKIITCLNDHQELCPGLRVLRVGVTEELCSSTFESVKKLILLRAGMGQQFRQVECITSGVGGHSETIKRLWDSLFLASDLPSYLSDSGHDHNGADMGDGFYLAL